jgi:hypothetical protein
MTEWKEVDLGCRASKCLACMSVRQQLCEAGIFMLPHWPFIWRQQLCSSGVIRAFGKTQAMVGESNDKQMLTATTT